MVGERKIHRLPYPLDNAIGQACSLSLARNCQTKQDQTWVEHLRQYLILRFPLIECSR